MSKTTAIAIFGGTLDLFVETLAENLEGGVVNILDLDHVAVPNGSRTFNIPSLEGEKNEQELTGVIIGQRLRRRYWPTKETTGEKPMCFSNDGVIGIGQPGGDCSSCPLNKFGSLEQYVAGATGNGKACKEMRELLILSGDSMMPMVLALPPTSLRKFNQYMLSLTSRGLSVGSVISRFRLNNDNINSANQKYTTIEISFERRLEPEEVEMLNSYNERVKPFIELDPPTIEDAVEKEA